MVRKTTVYTADSQVLAMRRVFVDMLLGVRDSTYVAYRLTIRDVKSEYAKSTFGMIWDLADPLVLGAVFYALMRVRVINPGEMAMPYAVFVTYGMLLYATFTDALLKSVGLFARSQSLLQHVKVSPEAYILSVLYRILFDSVFRVVVLLLFSVILGPFSPAGFSLFVLCYPIIIIAGMSIGVLLAPLNAIYGDIIRLVRIVVVPLRYVSPVMWLLPVSGLAGLLYTYNPVAVCIMNLRSLATSNTFSDPLPFVVWSGVFGITFLGGWLIFHISLPILADRR